MSYETIDGVPVQVIMKDVLKNAQQLSEGEGVSRKLVRAVITTPGVKNIKLRRGGGVEMDGEVVAWIAKPKNPSQKRG